ncbi:serine endoprotease [Rubripirellula tenax]|uniref:Serine endoprotease n=1 Tax=Rubripirellula tenax TaxID=2528015 RepID=A0A5C6EIB6_9BACT|nr:PDZ domain-containing protein [Rubripirellula tenax]TWU48792.1 serine endoprotease [Rubripirellula tenax]
MIRRFCLACLIVPLAASFLICDSPSADAQGLLRRIQSRIQGRIPQTAPPQRPAPNPTLSPPNTRPAPSAVPSTNGTADGMRRVSPVGAANPSNAGGSTPRTSAVNPSQSGRSILDPRAPGSKGLPPGMVQPGLQNDERGAAAKLNATETYGSSILSSSDPADAATSAASSRASIGVNVFEPADGTPGVEIAKFRSDSLADDSGMKVGDIIMAVEGNRTTSSRDVAEQLKGKKGGDRVKIQFRRQNRNFMVYIPLVETPNKVATESPAKDKTAAKPNTQQTPNVSPSTASVEPTLAAPKNSPTRQPDVTPTTAMNVTADLPESAKPTAPAATTAAPKQAEPATSTITKKKQAAPMRTKFGVTAVDADLIRGAVITEVVPKSPADRAGLQVDDRVVSINGRLLMDSESLMRQMDSRASDIDVAIQWVRGSKLLAADVHFNSPKTAQVADANGAGEASSGLSSILGGLFGSKNKEPSRADDAMAFGDEDSVKQVDFESTSKAKAGGNESDGFMELPPGKASKAEPSSSEVENAAKKQSRDDLLRQIEDLEAKLKRLKGTE